MKSFFKMQLKKFLMKIQSIERIEYIQDAIKNV